MLSLNRAACVTARRSLAGHWPAAVAVLACAAAGLGSAGLFYGIAEWIASPFLVMGGIAGAWSRFAITLLTALIQLFGFSPLYLGTVYWYWQTSYGVAEPVATVFSFYGSAAEYRRAVGLVFALGWRAVIVSGLSVMPAAAFLTLAEHFSAGSHNGIYTGGLYLVALVLAVLGLMLALLVMTRWFLAIPCFFADRSLTASQAVVLSHRITRTSRASLFVFLLQFAGWALLSLLILPMLFTVPYFFAAFSCRARFMIRRFCMAEENA